MNNESLLLSFFNQYLFNEAKQNIEHIEYFYQTNPNTSGNPFIGELINAIKNYNLDAIGEPLFRSILLRSQKTPQESDEIMKEVLKLKQYSREEVIPIAKDMRDVISTAIIRKASAKFGNSSSEFLKYLKNVNVSTGDLDVFSSTSFDQIDINSIIAESVNNTVKTNVDLINRAFPEGAIEMGQLIVISASPGSGKTLFSMNLALWFASIGRKTLYVSLADQKWKDFIVRMGSIAFGITFADAYRNIKDVYEGLIKITKNNLEVSVNTAGTVSADDIVDKAINENFDIIFVDYDGVLAQVNEGDSMYNSYGEAYNKFTKLSIGGKLVFICSQPKVTAWGNSQSSGGLISMGDLAESSRKSQIADGIIAISRISGSECPYNIFDIRLVKARRGKVGTHGTFIRNQSRFIEIPKGLADQLRMETEEREFTDQQIQSMSDRYRQSERTVQQAVKQEQQKQHDNPFS